MPKLFFKDALKSPGKLLALCFVAYLASMSFFVAGFLLLLGARWLQKAIQQKSNAIAAASAEAARAEAVSASAAEPSMKAAPAAAAQPEPRNAAPQPAPVRRYAKSAVVIPFKTGTRD